MDDYASVGSGKGKGLHMPKLFKKKGKRGRSRGTSPASDGGSGGRKKRFGRRRAKSVDGEPRRSRKNKSRSRSRGPRQLRKNVQAKLRSVAKKPTLPQKIPTVLNPLTLFGATKLFTSSSQPAVKSAATVASTPEVDHDGGSHVETSSVSALPWNGADNRSVATHHTEANNSYGYDQSPDYDPGAIFFIAKTKFFSDMCNKAFDFVDVDGNGTVDEKELYTGILLLHLKLGSYVGAAGCKPLDRKQCQMMFEKFDRNRSGDLDRREFQKVVTVLFSNVLIRVLVQWFTTILVVPLIARALLESFSFDSEIVWEYLTKPRSARGIELTLQDTINWDITDSISPFRTFVSRLLSIIMIGPDRFWSTLPLTFTCVVLGLMIVPWLLFQVDDMFQTAVGWNNGKSSGTNKKKRRRF